jgi:CRISPR/Cas system-associated exonuclease Cas4 (RecB family)
MAAIPQPPKDSPTVQAIYAAYEGKRSPLRPYLGVSQIGQACLRRIWYSFRWCGGEDHGGRMLRLFETGQLEEKRIIDNLRAIGCEMYEIDESTGRQWEFTAVSGHVRGHVDAIGRGVPEAPKAWHVFEFKTHNLKSFTDLQSKGLKLSKPEHYAQLIVYMLLAKIERGMYVAVEKDTDRLYTERLRWEEVKDDAARYLVNAAAIVASKTPPERISPDPESWSCRYCPFKSLCHGSVSPDPAVPCRVTCRSCVHSTPVIEDGGIGRWVCERHKLTLGEKEQATGCEDHLFVTQLITFAEAIDGGDDPAGAWVQYRKPDGTTFTQGKQGSQYRSTELCELPKELVGLGMVQEVKEKLGGVVVAEEVMP